MAQPWKIIESVPTDEGILELRQRGARDFLITVDSLVLMNSMANRSEIVLGELGCRHLANHPAPRVLVGGLGMGCTLRAVLDSLPPSAEVVVAELNPVVVAWCRGPLAPLTDGAVDDPRVTVEIGDVAALVRRTADDSSLPRFDAVVFDLYKGPHFRTDRRDDPLYGSRAIARVRAALKPGGVFTIWGENYDEGFDKRLQDAGFSTSSQRPGRGGYRHVVFVASLKGSPGKPSGR
ncbi:spermidine synthase [Desulfuromonas soudanensis]|uniref:Spermidine synthase n=1 Tax=Desulfuromonas soudanensis TaxID=1603606 RepID=A0A0M3QGP9_9BACT|nr:spermidine synthase [Desulfuromonas soudanensis]ALC18183.1 spermidine synthase [Desulfuromonas soudanensis]